VGVAYWTTVGQYSTADARAQLGHLVASVAEAGIASQRREQIDAWKRTLPILESMARQLLQLLPEANEWAVLLEYEIPRRARRPDVVLLARDVVFVLEFKVGGDEYRGPDRWQVRSYALDLRDFHQASRGRAIIPMLVPTSISHASIDLSI